VAPTSNFVIPAQAGTQFRRLLLGSRLRGNDEIEVGATPQRPSRSLREPNKTHAETRRRGGDGPSRSLSAPLRLRVKLSTSSPSMRWPAIPAFAGMTSEQDIPIPPLANAG